MESYNFSKADFTKKDIYLTIQAYLTTGTSNMCLTGICVEFKVRKYYCHISMLLFCFAVATPPKCYNPSDPMLRSTAWFYQYIGVFITFITVADLQQFGGIKVRKAESNSPKPDYSDVIHS